MLLSFLYACGKIRIGWDGRFYGAEGVPRAVLTIRHHGDSDDSCPRRVTYDLSRMKQSYIDLHGSPNWSSGSIEIEAPGYDAESLFADYFFTYRICTPSNHDPPTTEDQAVRTFRESSPVDFEECGWFTAETRECCELQEPGQECLTDAASACRPAHLQEIQYTTEASPIFHDYFVVPEEEGCSVLIFDDTTQDPYAAPPDAASSSLRSCGRISRVSEGEGCPRLVPSDCE